MTDDKVQVVAWVAIDMWKTGEFWPDDCFCETPGEGLTPLVLAADYEAAIARAEALTAQLAECFKLAGADGDGAGDDVIAPRAVRAVADLRRDYDESEDWRSRAEAAEALLREAIEWNWMSDDWTPEMEKIAAIAAQQAGG